MGDDLITPFTPKRPSQMLTPNLKRIGYLTATVAAIVVTTTSYLIWSASTVDPSTRRSQLPMLAQCFPLTATEAKQVLTRPTIEQQVNQLSDILQLPIRIEYASDQLPPDSIIQRPRNRVICVLEDEEMAWVADSASIDNRRIFQIFRSDHLPAVVLAETFWRECDRHVVLSLDGDGSNRNSAIGRSYISVPKFINGGIVIGDERRTCELRVHNLGDTPIWLEYAKASCGCTIIDAMAQSIPPKSSLALPVTISPATGQELVRSKIVLSLREGEISALYSIDVVANCVIGPTFSHSALDLGKPGAGSSVKRIVHISGSMLDQFDLMSVECDPPSIQSDFRLATPVHNIKTYILELIFPAEALSLGTSASILARTTSAIRPNLSLPVRWQRAKTFDVALDVSTREAAAVGELFSLSQ